MARSRVINLANFEQYTAINVLSDPGHIAGPVVVPNAVKVMPLWQLGDGKLTRNVLGGIVGSFTSASATAAEAIRAAIVGSGSFWTNLIALMAPTVSFVGIDLQDIRAAGQPVFRSTGAAIPGTSAGIELPNEVALVLTLRTASVGAGHRGRLFQPGWTSSSLGAGNQANAAAIAALQGYASAILAGMNAGGLQWGLILPARNSYTGSTGAVHPSRIAQISPISQTQVRDGHWDSQRRRGLK